MIIEWTYGAYAQLQRFFELGYIQTHSGGVEVPAVGEMNIAFTTKMPKTVFTDRQPGISYTGRKPNITFS